MLMNLLYQIVITELHDLIWKKFQKGKIISCDFEPLFVSYVWSAAIAAIVAFAAIRVCIK